MDQVSSDQDMVFTAILFAFMGAILTGLGMICKIGYLNTDPYSVLKVFELASVMFAGATCFFFERKNMNKLESIK